MKQYIETKEGSFTIDGMTIPNAEGNRHFRMMNEEVIANEATITPYDVAGGLVEDKIAQEQSWVSSELTRADLELNKHIDSDDMTVGSAVDWWKYRRDLRAHNRQAGYPDNDRPLLILTQ